jgi:hypothetical protein
LRCAASFIAAALVLVQGARTADEVMVPIRAFDIATTERLGREIYEQDQLVWKASDVLVAKRTRTQRENDVLQPGWITGTIDGKPRVRFIGAGGAAGIEALYDIVFDGDVGTMSTPSDKTLSAEELAQYDARMLALKGANNKCSPTYNTVALKDPAGPGWLVWALAATTDADAIIIGGHFRFTISADGKSVVSRDALSKGCLKFSRRQMAVTGAKVAGLGFMHLISLTPIETYVFAHLNYQLNMSVGTPDGLAWKIDGGRIANIDMDMPGYDGFSARVLAGIDEGCALIASRINEEPKKYYIVGEGLKVILATEGDRPFKAEPPAGHKTELVVCVRRDIVPAPNDYRVSVAGYPFMIGDKGYGHPKRNGTLTMDPNGHFVFETEGEIDAVTLARIEKRLRGFENAVRPGIASLRLGTRGGNSVTLSQARNGMRGIDLGALSTIGDERGGHLAIVRGATVYVPLEMHRGP